MTREKLAVVTGAAGGIGSSIVDSLRDDGFKVVGLDVEHCASADLSIQSDLTRWPDHETRVTNALGGQKIDALVNCAGVQITRGLVEEVGLDEIDRLYAHNFRSVVEVTQWALTRMTDGGGIVNIGSISGASSVSGLACYGALKAAVHSFSKSLAIELAPRGIRVNVVAPGYVRTPFIEGILADETRLSEVVSRIPWGSVADAQDIGPVVAALFTAPFQYVTGVVLPVDGGYLA